MGGRGQSTPILFFFFFLTLFLFVALCTEAQHQESVDHGVHCSRQRSRIAWRTIDEYLLPFVEQEGYTLPQTCRLHPDNDMFRKQEYQKEKITSNQWQCLYCKKVFVSEIFLDQHFDNRHHDMLNVSRDRCLADVCGALHCDYVSNLLKSKKDKRKCNSLAADKNRHTCENLANTCFPPQEGSKARRLNDFFLRQFCDAHTCNKRVDYFPRGKGNYGNAPFYYALSLFTVLLLLLFYGGMYLHTREMSKNVKELKRITQKTTSNAWKTKPY